jgi:polar amino acid transport system substrate-binding protein
MRDRPSAELRIAAWLESEAIDDVPHRVVELAFAQTRRLPQERRRPRLVQALRDDRRILLLAAAVALLTTIAAGAAVGAWLAQRGPDPDLLTRVSGAGFVRIAVRPDHPQAATQNIGVDGFDVDVATALAERLGVEFHVDIAPASDLVSSSASWSWDLALPSVGVSAIDPTRFASSAPYYYWPHYLLVESTSGYKRASDLAGLAICVVAADAGESWLRSPDGARAIPDSIVVNKPSDRDCLLALDSGDVAGIVTAAFGPADVAARPHLAALAGPPWEARAAIALRTAHPDAFIAEVNAAISAMLADGTLGQLARNRFGGYDVTTPPSP